MTDAERDAYVEDGLRALGEVTDLMRRNEELFAQRRELVMRLRACGVSNRRLANAMGVSEGAVAHLIRKARNEAEPGENPVIAGQRG